MAQLSALFELSTAYLACRDTDSLLKTFAAQLGKSLGTQAVLVWMGAEGEALRCRARWFEAGEHYETVAEPVAEGLLVEMQQAGGAQRLRKGRIDPETLQHLTETHRERVQTALYAPLSTPSSVAGVVEVLNKKSGDFTADDAALVEESSRITGRVLERLQAAEQDQLENLATIQRLTELYDISRIFNSTIELQELLPVIAEKILELSGGQACNIWLVDPNANDLYFAQQVGVDPSTDEDARVPLGEGLIGHVAQAGQARLVENGLEEPLLAARREKAPDFKIETAICAPLLKEDRVLAVVEVINKRDGSAFDEDDLFLLTNIGEQAAIALNNANLLEAERKVHELGALLAISKEITSTLNLDHVLVTVVNQAANVLPFNRCVIGLYDRNRFILGAVSGETEVPATVEMDRLRDLLEWVAGQPEVVRADQYEEGWVVQPEEGRERLTSYLNEQGYNGFYALPLTDEQGVVGVLALLSGDAEFLSENHLEVLSILSNQTTVAIRNARLYQDVPLMNIWQPLVERKRKLQAMGLGRWLGLFGKAALVVLVLVVVPWKMRISANAAVVPARHRVVSAEVEGVIQRILVREGDKVAAGEVLATLDDSNSRIGLDRGRTDLALAQRELQSAEAGGDLGAVAQARIRMEMAQDEVDLFQQKVAKAQIRAPINGVVVTPKVEEKMGRLLTPGDQFCELVDLDQMAVEMNVPESDEALIHPPAPVAIKLNTFSTRTFHGTVERVGAQTTSAEGEQFFVVRAVFPNPQDAARPGMAGRAKITASGGWFQSGWYPVGYVLLRSPGRWAWRKLWEWLP